MAFIVGVTGGIGSGKSVATDYLAKLGIDIIDADVVAREVVEPGEAALDKIACHFGSSIITSAGYLDRAELRKKIFASPEERKWLESLLHPIIRQRIIGHLNSSSSPYTILASPLLLETDQKTLVDHIVVIDVPVSLQLARATARDNNNEEQIKAIIAAQMPREERLANADTIICNDSDLASLEQKLKQLHKTLINAL